MLSHMPHSYLRARPRQVIFGGQLTPNCHDDDLDQGVFLEGLFSSTQEYPHMSPMELEVRYATKRQRRYKLTKGDAP
jgi:hypothetical protein